MTSQLGATVHSTPESTKISVRFVLGDLSRFQLSQHKIWGRAQKNCAQHKKTVLSTKKLCSVQKNCAQHKKTVLGTEKLCSAQKNCAQHKKIVLCQIVCALRSIYRCFRPIMRVKTLRAQGAQKYCSTVCPATCLGFSD